MGVMHMEVDCRNTYLFYLYGTSNIAKNRLARYPTLALTLPDTDPGNQVMTLWYQGDVTNIFRQELSAPEVIKLDNVDRANHWIAGSHRTFL